MKKLFFLICIYMVMVVQLVRVISFDFSKFCSSILYDQTSNLLILLILVGLVYYLSKKLIKDMLTEK